MSCCLAMKTFVLLSILCVNLTFAKKGFGTTEQQWGFVTVREGAHIFWWLHQTSADVENFAEKPLIIWLQGGPGASSTGFGNFAEIGPLDVDLIPRNTTWLNSYNVLFVDSPVGTGYSHVDSNIYLTENNKQIAEDFVALLKGFYEAVPDLVDAPLYIFSESYGGKMTVEIALLIDKAIKEGVLDIELLGVGLGDPWVSPIDCVLTWGSYLLNLGLVDQNNFEKIQEVANLTKYLLDIKEDQAATNSWGLLEYLISEVTGNIDFYNILTKVSFLAKTREYNIKPGTELRDILDDKIQIIMNGQVRKALGLNVTWGDQQYAVFEALSKDFMRPVTDLVELLLNTTEIKVAVFNGQLDLIVDTPGTVAWVDKLKFQDSTKWKEELRNFILVDGVIEGYYKKMGNFAMYWVNRAGHMVPADNPAAMNFILEDMIEKSK